MTIDAPPEEVWPWLVQMGLDRGGFHSYDRLDNEGQPSATTIIPELQDLQEGDEGQSPLYQIPSMLSLSCPCRSRPWQQ